MKKGLRIVFVTLIAAGWLGCNTIAPKSDVASTPSAQRNIASMDLQAEWAYDPGPSPNDQMGKELIDIVATQPAMPAISEELTGDQKFRPAFGPTLWRMIQQPNSVKILFIGQDGTHIAEAAGRTATAGFGGRAQDLAAYFGVRTGAAFMNTFAYTIRGQYSAFQTPIFMDDGSGRKKVSLSSVVDSGVWMMAQDQNSPMVKWRNSLIDWIIRNNRNSLKMIVLFGGSAQDSIGTFIESRGGHVGTRFSAQDLEAKGVKVPMFDLQSAGGNNEFPTVLDTKGQDIYPKLVGRRLNYSKPEDQKAAQQALTEKINDVYGDIAITGSGVGHSGVMHPAQINGFDLNKIEIGGKRTLSLKGLQLSDGSRVSNDVLIAEFPHPTALSMMPPKQASDRIASSLTQLQPYVRAGWRIDADPGMTNQYTAGQAYKYGRTDIGPAYYDFGTPKNRMVSVSSASRMTGKPNVIIIGTREKAMFDLKAIDAAARTRQPAGIPTGELFTARPRLPNTRAVFDRGPGEQMARIMKENIDMAVIGAPKKGMNAKTSGIAAFNIKTHPVDVGDFGHYRGTFEKPRVVILADPDGVDDILTSRALTGTRGQYLQGLMDDVGVKDDYLVLKTVPFGMDGASDAEWNTVLGQTAQYRSEVFKAVLAQSRPDLVIADGRFAASQIDALVGNEAVPVVKIDRVGSENNSGLKDAAAEIAKLPKFRGAHSSGQMANIPRTHLGFFARVWEGTGGTHVFDSTSAADKGTAFAIVAPMWSYNQKAQQSSDERKGVDTLKLQLNKEVPRPGENFLQFKQRFNPGRDSSRDRQPTWSAEVA